MPKPTFFNLPDDKRRTILDLAIDEFAAHDYQTASLSNIVVRAGIAKGSVYQYFADKRELYLYLLQLAAEEKKRFLAQSQPPDPGMNLFDILRWLVVQGTHFELSNPKLAQVAYRALFGDRPLGDEPFTQLRRAAVDFYRQLIQAGMTQGAVDPGLDPELVVFVFSTLFNAFGRYLIEHSRVDPAALGRGDVRYQDLPHQALSQQLIHILEHGVAPRTPPAAA